MVVHEAPLTDRGNESKFATDSPTSKQRLTRKQSALAGLGSCAGGIALVFTGTAGMDRFNMLLRVVVVALGLIVSYHGIRILVRGISGRVVSLPFVLSMAWITSIVAAAVLAPVLPLGEHVDTVKTITVPGYLRPDLFSSHPLGTNQFGLDMLSRVVWGARYSLASATIAILVGTVIGGLTGVMAGFFKGRADQSIGVATNIGLAFPPLVLLLVLAAVVGHTLLGVAGALAILVIPGTVRVARANALAASQKDHTFSAYILGAPRRRIMLREVLPSVAATLSSLAILTLPFLIVAEATLSFLGFGIRPPQPTWGNMIAEGQGGVFESNPHIVLVPGAALLLTVLSLNVIGQRVRKKWDPREGNF